MHLAAVQFTPVFGDKKKNLSCIYELTKNLEADILVLPELCTTGYFFDTTEKALAYAETASGETVRFFRQLSDEKNVILVAGFIERDGEAVYNACMTLVPGDPDPHIYRKTHLFYKERVAFDEGNTGFFVVRDPLRDISIGTMICYDWRFPEATRTLALQGADLIVCPSNLVTDIWRTVMPARAIENKIYIAVANRAGVEADGDERLCFTGNSAIYNYNGTELAKADPTRHMVITAEIFPEKTRDKSFNPFNDILKDRRPGFYRL
jgi:5-aminopentanamidase